MIIQTRKFVGAVRLHRWAALKSSSRACSTGYGRCRSSTGLDGALSTRTDEHHGVREEVPLRTV